jgi:hypothetical protein
MNPHLHDIHSSDRDTQGAAYRALSQATQEPVEWAYDAWDTLVEALAAKDNRLRSIASQILANLASKSDPENRIAKDFDSLLNVTRDEKFVTARHAMQAIWKVGLANQKLLVKGLAIRYNECAAEKNGTLIRYDILEGLRKLHDAKPDEKLRKLALEWIASETDAKYRKKYATLWR